MGKCVSKEDGKVYNYRIIKNRVLGKIYMVNCVTNKAPVIEDAVFLDEEQFKIKYIDYSYWLDTKIENILK